jgi:hypothetical protein
MEAENKTQDGTNAAVGTTQTAAALAATTPQLVTAAAAAAAMALHTQSTTA